MLHTQHKSIGDPHGRLATTRSILTSGDRIENTVASTKTAAS